MSNKTARRAVFHEIKQNSTNGITLNDLITVTNEDTKEVTEALTYFKRNAIVTEKETTEGKKWYVSY